MVCQLISSAFIERTRLYGRAVTSVTVTPAAHRDLVVGHLVGKLLAPDSLRMHRFAVLESMRVDPSLRGRGNGSMLIKYHPPNERNRVRRFTPGMRRDPRGAVEAPP